MSTFAKSENVQSINKVQCVFIAEDLTVALVVLLFVLGIVIVVIIIIIIKVKAWTMENSSTPLSLVRRNGRTPNLLCVITRVG